MTTFMTRRRLLRVTAMAAAAVPLGSLLSRPAAADAPLISPSDPAAAAVQYVEDASQSKAAKPGSKCATCALYQGAAGSAQGPCALFAGKQVKAAGWCSAWAPKAA
jgi:hypothetical protein